MSAVSKRAPAAPMGAAIRMHEVALRRAPVWIGLAAIVAACWWFLLRTGAGPMAHGTMPMSSAHGEPLGTVFVMWAVMMAAMMLPSVVPAAALFSVLAARRDARGGNRVLSAYVGGYALAWLAYASALALLQSMLVRAMLLDPMMQRMDVVSGAVILFVAGAYQLTPLKRACLSKCRTPLGFFLANWRDGVPGAFVLGLHHGAWCVACCWALMALLFVVGAMNLAWMGVLTLVVLAEKIAPARWHLATVLGAALVVAGTVVAMHAALGS